MNATVYDAQTAAEAIVMCQVMSGWTPDAVREVDSGQDGVRAWM
jgi:hypothetical protein